jgi:uncharacterized protein (TIRG00374 family)
LLLFTLALNVIDLSSANKVSFGSYSIDRSVIVQTKRGMIFLGAAITAVIVLLAFEGSRKKIEKLLEKSPRLLFFAKSSFKDNFTEKFKKRITLFIENIASGVALVKSPRRIIICFVYSSLVWLFTIYSYYAVSRGSPGIDLSAPEITAVMVVICFAIALPSVPGYWGLWEAGGVFALSFFGIGQKDAVGFTLANHAIQVIPVIVVGIISAWVTGVKFRSVTGQLDHSNPNGDEEIKAPTKL